MNVKYLCLAVVVVVGLFSAAYSVDAVGVETLRNKVPTVHASKEFVEPNFVEVDTTNGEMNFAVVLCTKIADHLAENNQALTHENLSPINKNLLAPVKEEMEKVFKSMIEKSQATCPFLAPCQAAIAETKAVVKQSDFDVAKKNLAETLKISFDSKTSEEVFLCTAIVDYFAEKTKLSLQSPIDILNDMYQCVESVSVNPTLLHFVQSTFNHKLSGHLVKDKKGNEQKVGHTFTSIFEIRASPIRKNIMAFKFAVSQAFQQNLGQCPLLSKCEAALKDRDLVNNYIGLISKKDKQLKAGDARNQEEYSEFEKKAQEKASRISMSTIISQSC